MQGKAILTCEYFENFLYKSLLLPYINYCNLIRASTYAFYLKPLYVLQMEAVRIITFSPPRISSKPLFSKHNFLSLYSIHKFHVACFVFSHFNSLLLSVSSILHFNFEYQISSKKTKRLRTNARTNTEIKLRGETIEEVENFTYLGSKMATSGDGEEEIRARLSKASQAFAALRNT